MKLIFCPFCHDLFRLWDDQERSCRCGCVKGRYLEDGKTAEITDGAIPIGIDNFEFVRQVKQYQDGTLPYTKLNAWIFMPGYERIIKKPLDKD